MSASRMKSGSSKGVGGQFVVGVSVDPAVMVAVVTPASGRVTIIPFTVAPFVGLFALVVAPAMFAPMRIRPGAEFRAIA